MEHMSKEEFDLGYKLIWDAELGSKITCDPELSEKLALDLREAGINVTRVGRKPRSRNKFILFEIECVRIEGLDMMFLTEEEAQNWHKAKNRSLRTLMKAPDEAFNEIKTEKCTEMLWWSQAYKLTYRVGKITHAKEGILKRRGSMYGKSFGL